MIEYTNNLQEKTYQDALHIRTKVFINEQDIPAHVEVDELEALCTHFVLYTEDQKPVTTARIFEKENNQCKVQRVATLKEYRGRGFGRKLLEAIEDYGKARGITSLILGAQNTAIPFYQKTGYTIQGEEYFEAGLPHHDMVKFL